REGDDQAHGSPRDTHARSLALATNGVFRFRPRSGLRAFGASRGHTVPVVLAELAGRLLGQRVAVSLAVRRAHERGHNLEIPLGDVVRLAPEIGEPEVDVELEQLDAGWSLGHENSVGTPSDRHPQPREPWANPVLRLTAEKTRWLGRGRRA